MQDIDADSDLLVRMELETYVHHWLAEDAAYLRQCRNNDLKYDKLPAHFFDDYLEKIPFGYDVDVLRRKSNDLPFLAMLWNESLSKEETLNDGVANAAAGILRRIRYNYIFACLVGLAVANSDIAVG